MFILFFCIRDLIFLLNLLGLIFLRVGCCFFVICDKDCDCFCVDVFCCSCFEGRCSKFGEENIFLVFIGEFVILFDFIEGFFILLNILEIDWCMFFIMIGKLKFLKRIMKFRFVKFKINVLV